MNNLTTRLSVAAILVVLIYLGTYAATAAMKPPKVAFPDRPLQDLPRQFVDREGTDWEGKDIALNPRVFAAIGAEVVVDRKYQDKAGNEMVVHTAIFEDPVEGMYHSPMNCYRGSGWRNTDQTSLDLKISDELSLPVSLTTWEREGVQKLVVYWYQIGEHTVFHRSDLWSVRWAMRGRETWPALVKVLIDTPIDDPEKAQERIIAFAENIGRWIHESYRQPGSSQSTPPELPGNDGSNVTASGSN